MAIEIEIEVLKTVVYKLDSSLEKISEVSNVIGKLLAVHDERLNSIEKASDKREEEIRDLQTRITTQTREIVEKLDTMEVRIEEQMKDNAAAATAQYKSIQQEIKVDIEKMNERVSLLERWRWYVLGASAIIGYVVSKYLDFTHLLK